MQVKDLGLEEISPFSFDRIIVGFSGDAQLQEVEHAGNRVFTALEQQAQPRQVQSHHQEITLQPTKHMNANTYLLIAAYLSLFTFVIGRSSKIRLSNQGWWITLVITAACPLIGALLVTSLEWLEKNFKD